MSCNLYVLICSVNIECMLKMLHWILRIKTFESHYMLWNILEGHKLVLQKEWFIMRNFSVKHENTHECMHNTVKYINFTPFTFIVCSCLSLLCKCLISKSVFAMCLCACLWQSWLIRNFSSGMYFGNGGLHTWSL